MYSFLETLHIPQYFAALLCAMTCRCADGRSSVRDYHSTAEVDRRLWNLSDPDVGEISESLVPDVATASPLQLKQRGSLLCNLNCSC
ncbi:hypothetical protein GE09DRAFT_678788 [Coniochaeta sp. 2T2.1]|nr:hypothetical protein GE09DRAFT_678788 [Coniochaeta sp. 2T2.1]